MERTSGIVPQSRQPTDEHLLESKAAAAVDSLARNLAEDAFRPKAEVVLPSDAMLKVRLVKLEDLLRYQELAGDESVVSGAMYTLIGALLGTFINVVTGGSLIINGATWVAIIAIGIALI